MYGIIGVDDHYSEVLHMKREQAIRCMEKGMMEKMVKDITPICLICLTWPKKDISLEPRIIESDVHIKATS